MRGIEPKFNVNLFVYNRLRNDRFKKFIGRRMVKFLSNRTVCDKEVRFHSHCKPNELISNVPTNINPICKRPLLKTSSSKRFTAKPKLWHLSPARYTLPSYIGSKRVFISRLERTEETIISHCRRMKATGEFKFYDKASLADKLNNKCCYYKGVFTSNPRERKPTARSMIRDNNCAIRSPILGPATYYLKQHCLGSKRLSKLKPVFIYKFNENSTVPVSENNLYNNIPYFGADPTVYYPYPSTKRPASIRCDQPDIGYKIEQNKIKKSRRLPYNAALLNISIETDFEKHIKGHGHTSRFVCSKSCQKSKVNVLPTTTLKSATKELAFNYLDLDYLKMITNPQRKIISIRDPPKKSILKPIIIHYMATQKPVIRKKLLDTPNLAFNSTQPRWKGDINPKLLVDKTTEKKEKKKMKKIIKPEVKSKLYDIKRKNLSTDLTRNVSKLMQYKFSKEPQTKVLVPSNYIGDFGTKQLQFYLEELPYEHFFKDLRFSANKVFNKANTSHRSS